MELPPGSSASSNIGGKMTREELLSKGQDWNLACDNALLLRLQDFSENLIKSSHEITADCDFLSNNISTLQFKLSNVTNEFLMLGNTHFVENCVQEFNEECNSNPPNDTPELVPQTKAEKESALIEKMKEAIQIGIKVQQQRDIQRSAELEESTSSASSRFSSSVNLAHLIGSSKFFSSKYCGLRNENRYVEGNVEIIDTSSSASTTSLKVEPANIFDHNIPTNSEPHHIQNHQPPPMPPIPSISKKEPPSTSLFDGDEIVNNSSLSSSNPPPFKIDARNLPENKISTNYETNPIVNHHPPPPPLKQQPAPIFAPQHEPPPLAPNQAPIFNVASSSTPSSSKVESSHNVEKKMPSNYVSNEILHRQEPPPIQTSIFDSSDSDDDLFFNVSPGKAYKTKTSFNNSSIHPNSSRPLKSDIRPPPVLDLDSDSDDDLFSTAKPNLQITGNKKQNSDTLFKSEPTNIFDHNIPTNYEPHHIQHHQPPPMPPIPPFSKTEPPSTSLFDEDEIVNNSSLSSSNPPPFKIDARNLPENKISTNYETNPIVNHPSSPPKQQPPPTFAPQHEPKQVPQPLTAPNQVPPPLTAPKQVPQSVVAPKQVPPPLTAPKQVPQSVVAPKQVPPPLTAPNQVPSRLTAPNQVPPPLAAPKQVPIVNAYGGGNEVTKASSSKVESANSMEKKIPSNYEANEILHHQEPPPIQTSIFDSSDSDDDLFSIAKPRLQITGNNKQNSTTHVVSKQSSSLFNSASKQSSSLLNSASKQSSSLFNSASKQSSSLFNSASKQSSSLLNSASKKSPSLFDDDSENETDDLFGSGKNSTTAVTSKQSSSIFNSASKKSPSLFNDDSENETDDLFGSGKNSTTAVTSKQSSSTFSSASKKSTSLFNDDSDNETDDLFSSAKTSTKIVKTARHPVSSSGSDFEKTDEADISNNKMTTNENQSKRRSAVAKSLENIFSAKGFSISTSSTSISKTITDAVSFDDEAFNRNLLPCMTKNRPKIGHRRPPSLARRHFSKSLGHLHMPNPESEELDPFA